ncbi:hypothetical protein BD410DRAFT_226567 [Rickenella mellea]|uniref:Zn(2)-C6 fungal-type domain-containing protein n=1 Tax=Rickenella mellea TaxID=50990 RepID=A0A4Y7QM73_9AGAM|nr:hypothetical protein BD410DRAFT_226567 [Rickenella mellea]
MPRASSSSAAPILRRNQACRTCRKKKLKCDAARPHCSNCVKAWKGLISVPAPEGFAHPPEPQCSYDPIEGLTLSDSVNPAEKIRQLEEQVSELKCKLHDAGLAWSPAPSNGQLEHANGARSATQPASFDSPPYGVQTSPPNGRGDITLPRAGLNETMGFSSPRTVANSRTSSPGIRVFDPTHRDPMELLYSGWNPDLPDPDEMNKLVTAFFENDPCGSRILHRPSFELSMLLSPRDPRFPHPAVLHAICAAASRWTSPGEFTPDQIRRDKFSDYHAAKTRQYIDRTMASGKDIFYVLQACVILTWYLYAEGRWVEVWIFAAFQTRVSIPLRLNYQGTYTLHGSSSPGAYLAPPQDLKDLEMRRRTWWMSIVMDRIASVGGWLHSIDEQDIATELPLTKVDFYSDRSPYTRPQDLASDNFFTDHPPEMTDSFLLFIKAVMLFGKVTNYNNRWQLRTPADPAMWGNPFESDELTVLDKLVSSGFIESLPPTYKNYLETLSQSPGLGVVDSDLFMVHVIPHAATITLHNHLLDWKNPKCISNTRCMAAAQAILDAYYVFMNASSTPMPASAPPPVTRLHPFVVICWYLAAVVKVRVCTRMIEIGDSTGELEVWKEINNLRWAMLRFGDCSPIGVRQEGLLQGVMAEIVRKTKHNNPDQLVPLYPFSHKGIFSETSRSYNADDSVAPLPVSPPYDDGEPSLTMPNWELPATPDNSATAYQNPNFAL